MAILAILIPVLYVLGIGAVAYAVIRFAVVHALRQARHEARVEQRLPRAATWLKGEEHRLLEITNASHDKA